MALQGGLSITQSMVVSEKDTAKYHGSGNLDVFATPAMVAFMENTAVVCIENELDEGLDTVGIQIDTKHIKATGIGCKVSCKAQLVRIEGKGLFFEIEVWDEQDVIGNAYHVMYIIDPVKFMSRV